MTAPGQTGPWRHVGVESVLSPISDIGQRRRHGSSVPQAVIAPLHSITSSARPSRVSGKVRPNVLAVVMLIISSTFTVCCTGRSAGFSPLRIRPV